MLHDPTKILGKVNIWKKGETLPMSVLIIKKLWKENNFSQMSYFETNSCFEYVLEIFG